MICIYIGTCNKIFCCPYNSVNKGVIEVLKLRASIVTKHNSYDIACTLKEVLDMLDTEGCQIEEGSPDGQYFYFALNTT